MSNIYLIAFMRGEKQDNEASNEDGITTIIAEIVGKLLRLFQEFLENIETQNVRR